MSGTTVDGEGTEHGAREWGGAALVLVFALAVNLALALVAWHNPILDRHGFRQTQTALTTYWTVRDGFTLAYPTPLFGPPWSIPFELPLYQWAVAALHLASGLALEQAGRLVSLLAFYAALPAVYLLARKAFANRDAAVLTVALTLVNPTYIFWSRTFLMESTALLLALWWLWLFVLGVERRGRLVPIAAALVGALAGTVKVTTWAVLLAVAAVLTAWRLVDALRRRDRAELTRVLVRAAAMTAPGVLATAAWTRFADHLKAENPLAAALTSGALVHWNFGTIAQRLDPALWAHWVVGNSGLGVWAHGLGGRPLVVAAVVLLGVGSVTAAARDVRLRAVVVLSCVGLASGPLVFFNLYRHDYYQYATGIFLSALGAASVTGALRLARATRRLGLLVAGALVVVGAWGYVSSIYFTDQLVVSPQARRTLALARRVRAETEPDDVVAFVDSDWTSEYAYYSRRRAIMLPAEGPRSISGDFVEPVVEAIRRNGGHIGAAVFLRPPSNEELERAIELFATPADRIEVRPPLMLFRRPPLRRGAPAPQPGA